MNRHLKPSLITSFDPRGFLANDNANPCSSTHLFKRLTCETGIEVAAEIYFLMESDVRQQAPTAKHLDACEYLASLSPEHVRDLAHRVYRCFNHNSVNIIGCATFFPEVAHSDPQRKEKSRKAIVNTIRFADHLTTLQSNSNGCSNPVIIELVCGSVTQPIEDAETKPQGEKTLQVPILQEPIFSTILDVLSSAIRDSKTQRNPQIALELEPGPLFALRNIETLRQLSMAIKTHPDAKVQQCVGLNADLAHWWIAGDIELETEAAKTPNADNYFFDLIKHSHISGHHPAGHFGDFGLQHLDEPTAAKLRSWLQCLANAQPPNYSGFVSVELEAAFSDREVIDSVKTLIRWIEAL